MRHVRRVFPATIHAPEPALGITALVPLAAATLLLTALLGAYRFDWPLSPATWNLARGSGLTLYLLSWWLLVSGLAGKAHLLRRSGHRQITLSLHTYAAHLWLGMLIVHVLALVADPTIYFGPRETLLPFRSPWREPWTGFGIAAAEIGVIILASSFLLRLLGYRAWKAIHWLSLPVFAMGLAHGLGVGTDRNSLPIFLLYLATASVAVFLAFYRLATCDARARARDARATPEPAIPRSESAH